jgi:hypothetical protein
MSCVLSLVSCVFGLPARSKRSGDPQGELPSIHKPGTQSQFLSNLLCQFKIFSRAKPKDRNLKIESPPGFAKKLASIFKHLLSRIHQFS